MFSVALIGADGSGKSTVATWLAEHLEMKARYLYMGVNLESSNRVLPTTRWLLRLKEKLGNRPDLAGPTSGSAKLPDRLPARIKRELKSLLRVTNLIGEEWFRQWWIRRSLRSGEIAVLDRHFFIDYYFHDIAPTSDRRTWASRVHGWQLRRFYPRPDLVICLDAPAEVFYERKREASIEALENRRQEYLAVESAFSSYYIVDARRPLDQVCRTCAELIEQHYRQVTGFQESTGPVQTLQTPCTD